MERRRQPPTKVPVQLLLQFSPPAYQLQAFFILIPFPGQEVDSHQDFIDGRRWHWKELPHQALL
jgi:hypothetical protein